MINVHATHSYAIFSHIAFDQLRRICKVGIRSQLFLIKGKWSAAQVSTIWWWRSSGSHWKRVDDAQNTWEVMGSDIYWNFRRLNVFYVIRLVWSTGISEFKWVVNFLNLANIPELSRSDGAQMFIACWPTNTHLRLTALPQNRVYLLQCKRNLWHQWFGCELFGDLKLKEDLKRCTAGRSPRWRWRAGRARSRRRCRWRFRRWEPLQMCCLVGKLLGKMMDSPAINFTRG